MKGDSDLSVGDLSEGDRIVVEYKSRNAPRDAEPKQMETEVVEVSKQTLDGFEFGEAYLAEYRNEDDTIPRRRLRFQAGDPTLEFRRTTRNGPVWQKMSTPTGCTVRRAD